MTLQAALPSASLRERLRARLHPPVVEPLAADQRQAAVAAVVRLAEQDTAELLLMRRAEHPLDPWSGHMALPGGRVDPGDASPLAAALRETREEIGLALDEESHLLGRLGRVPVVARGRRLPMVIEPFVFGIDTPPELVLNEEVEETLWVPLSFFAATENRLSFLWERPGWPAMSMPCYDVAGRRVWGLTLRMIDELVARAFANEAALAGQTR